MERELEKKEAENKYTQKTKVMHLFEHLQAVRLPQQMVIIANLVHIRPIIFLRLCGAH